MKRTVSNTSSLNLIIGLVVFNLAFKGALIGVNGAEYTDGILQITLFRSLNSIYPPLFPALTTILAFIVRDLEIAGRIVSVVTSSLTVIPLFLITKRLFGKQAAVYSVAFYTVSPIPLRWAVHAMTDATFGLLYLTSIWLFLLAWLRCEEGESASGRQTAVWAIAISVLATLTRYQGILLLPLGLMMFVYDRKRTNSFSAKILFAHLLWALPVAWAAYAGFIHGGQISERTTGSLALTSLNYWFHFESWLTYLPYFFTPLIFAFILGGFFIGPDDESRKGRGVYLLFAIGLAAAFIVLQTVFSSFQSRYMLPVLLMLLPFAGRCADALERRSGGSRFLRSVHHVLISVAIVYALLFGLLVVSLQRGAFADIKEASCFVRELNPTGRVYCNEVYREGMTGIKAAFWSEREVELANAITLQSMPPLKENDIFIWTSIYGGRENYPRIVALMRSRHGMVPVQQFTARIYPLFPDIMDSPRVSQNPIAVAYRHQPQEFMSVVFAHPDILKKTN